MKALFLSLILFISFSNIFSQSTKQEIESLKKQNAEFQLKISSLENDISNLKLYIKEQNELLKTFIKEQNERLLNTLEGSIKNNKSLQENTTPLPLSSPSNTNKQNKNQSAPSTIQNTGQCKATTKAGKQCSRTAKSNGYCWQHGGN